MWSKARCDRSPTGSANHPGSLAFAASGPVVIVALERR